MEEWRTLDAAHSRPKPSRRTAALIITPIIVLIALANLGDILTTTWATEHPLALLALNARNRVALLVTNQLDPVSYYVVGTVRLLISDPLFFLLGMYYGDTAVEWVEKRSKTFGEQLRLYEKAFKKAAYPLVFIAPNNIICLLAGAAGIPLGAFIVLNVIGTVLRLYLLRVVGDVFSSPIDSVLQFFGDYRLPLFIASVVIFGGIILLDRRRGKSEIGDLLHLEEELEHGDDRSANP
jgi:membrane protein DedA with SNARE-associated domain